MKDASPFEVDALVKGYPRGSAWHCTFYTPAGRQRRKLGTRNKRQAERRARELADLIQRESGRLLEGVQVRLEQHSNQLHDRLSGALKEYFDPQNGRFHERVERLGGFRDEAGLPHFEIPARHAQEAQVVHGEVNQIGPNEGDPEVKMPQRLI